MKDVLRIAMPVYLTTAAAIFTFAAIGKLVGHFDARELDQFDFFIAFLRTKQLLIVAAFLELSVSLLIVATMRRRSAVGLGLALWLAFLCVIYRVGVGWYAPEWLGTVHCRCFGSGQRILGVNSQTTALVSLAYLLLGGGGLSLLNYFHSRCKTRQR